MINADEIAGILKQQIEQFNTGVQEDEVGTVIEVGANLARVYGLRGVRASELVEFANGAARRRAQPRRGQRRRRHLGPRRRDQRRRQRAAHRPHRLGARRRGAARPRRQSARRADRRQGRDRGEALPHDRERRAERRAASARQAAAADRHPRDRRADPDRQGPARADHRRPLDRQDGDRHRHDHQSERAQRLLHLRRDRAEELDRRGARADPRAERRDGVHDDRRRQPVGGGGAALDRAVRRLRDGRGADVRRQRRAHRLRRSHEARAVVSRDVAAAAPSAGTRSLSGRRLLPALAPAGARREALRRDGRRVADGAAGHRDAGRRLLRLHSDERHLDHRRPDLSDAAALLPRHSARRRRRPLRFARRRFGADQGDEVGGRPAQARARAVPRSRGLRQALERPRQGDAESADARRED